MRLRHLGSRREDSEQFDWLRALLKNQEGAEGVDIDCKALHQLPRHQLPRHQRRFGLHIWSIIKMLNKTPA
jgi:hypothetical protein